MRFAFGQFRELTEENLTFAAQLGVTGIQLNTPNLPGETHWEAEDLRQLRLKCELFGLRLEAIENIPPYFYEKVMLGKPGKEEQMAYVKQTVRNLGIAGIPVFGYSFMPNFVWRTSFESTTRGNARVSSYDHALVEPDIPGSVSGNLVTERLPKLKKMIQESITEVISEAQMWENYAYFIQEIIPVAEAAGVRLALHPADPPVEMLSGVPRLFNKPDDFRKAMQMANSDAWGIDLCLGSCSSMKGGAATVREMIHEFGPIGKIVYVHFRDVQGTVPKFQECFLGEGNYNPYEMMRLLHDVGFDGFIIDDHVPNVVGDTPWGHRGRAHQTGFLQGILHAIEHAKQQ
jgi:mannonate dehydratase